jgi:hypothetical protein
MEAIEGNWMMHKTPTHGLLYCFTRSDEHSHWVMCHSFEIPVEVRVRLTAQFPAETTQTENPTPTPGVPFPAA